MAGDSLGSATRYWRETFRWPLFFFVDARAATPLVLVFVHISWTTLIIAMACLVIAWQLSRRGMDPVSAMRYVRSWLAGPVRPGMNPTRLRGRIDYDRSPFLT
jgi:intracellular multiplication protein IcmT